MRIGVLLFVVCCFASPRSMAEFGYLSLEEAVVAATDTHNPDSVARDVEYMGAILKHQGPSADFGYTVTAGRAGRDEIRARILVPAGYEIVAFWHTHGGREQSRKYFSGVDIRLVDRWQLPLYLADYTGQLKVLEPGARRLSLLAARRSGLTGFGYYARGRLVRDSAGDVLEIDS